MALITVDILELKIAVRMTCETLNSDMGSRQRERSSGMIKARTPSKCVDRMTGLAVDREIAKLMIRICCLQEVITMTSVTRQ